MFNPSTYDTHMLYFIIACFFVLVSIKSNERTSVEASTRVVNSLIYFLMTQAITIFVFTFLGMLNNSFLLEEFSSYRIVYGITGAFMGFLNFALPYYLFTLLGLYIGGKHLFYGIKHKLIFMLFAFCSIFYWIIAGSLVFQYFVAPAQVSTVLYNLTIMVPIAQVIFFVSCIKYLHLFMRNILENSFASKPAAIFIEVFFIVSPILSVPISHYYFNYPIIFSLLVSFAFVVQIVSQDRAISVDFLTGLNNRKELNRYLKRLFEKQSELDHNLNIIFIDINDFKGVNDTYGHNVGDKTLIELSNCLKRTSGKLSNCFLCRYAGDEFTVVLKETTSFTVENYKSELQAQIDKLNSSGSLPFALSVSLGHVQYQERFTDFEEFLAQADQNMYTQKEAYKASKSLELNNY